MSQDTYSCEGIVLKKTKLAETDLIITFLISDGSKSQFVARGARKPSSTFSSRLETFSVVKLLCIKTKSIDIIKECRLIDAHKNCRDSFEKNMFASIIVEVAKKISEVGLNNPKLFECTLKTLGMIDDEKTSNHLLLCSTFLFKAAALCGIKPSFDTCVICGRNFLDNSNYSSSQSSVRFSFAGGGVLCDRCSTDRDSIRISTEVIHCIEALLYSTLDEILSFNLDQSTVIALLKYADEWIALHFELSLNSVKFALNYYDSY